MDLLVLKVLTLVLFLMVTITMVSLPMLIWDKIRGVRDPRKRQKYEAAISYVSCLGGGVFLSTIFLHLLPESRLQLNKGLEMHHIKTTFPVLELICIIGFLLVLTLEQLALTWKEHDDALRLAALAAGNPTTHLNGQPLASHYGTLPNGPFHVHGDFPPGSLSRPENFPQDDEEEEEDPDYHSVHEDPSSHSALRTFILVLSLSVHSVFEGMAIGVQQDLQSTVQLLAAVAIHKCILAFTLGLNLRPSRLKRCAVVACSVLFSAMAPIGIAIGIVIIEEGGQGAILATGVLQGISCGTFLYVTFFEVLPHEMNVADNRLGKLISLVIGVSIIAGLLVAFPSK
ncbi:zinc transporter ZIP1-like [Ornithodoros turicata]|uniref:zinc transporter ZIP1-like n=1 Tax=Ornithodoros turicata TaxID=34597 RepID=UPI003138BA03